MFKELLSCLSILSQISLLDSCHAKPMRLGHHMARQGLIWLSHGFRGYSLRHPDRCSDILHMAQVLETCSNISFHLHINEERFFLHSQSLLFNLVQLSLGWEAKLPYYLMRVPSSILVEFNWVIRQWLLFLPQQWIALIEWNLAQWCNANMVTEWNLFISHQGRIYVFYCVNI